MKYYKFLLAGFFTTFILSVILFSNLFAKDNLNQSRLDGYSKIRKVISAIENYYVDDISINEIVDKAISGLLTNLDAHSAYLTPKDYQDLKVQTSGKFDGIGIQISLKDGALTIISPIEGSPGDKAGLKSGDIILKINDQSTLNMTIDDAVNLMRGKRKTSVKLTIIRKNELKPLVFNIQRDTIDIISTYAKKIENTNYLYLRINTFDEKVTKNVESIVKSNNPNGIIIDLRNNPGGLLDQAVGLANLFIKNGVIVSQRGKVKNSNEEFNANGKAPFDKIPLVIIVNGGSASASEIVAGSLQDHKRAIIIGENTFGKGSVQIVLPLDNNENSDALRLTTARYYLPSGRTIQAVGIKPDIVVHPGFVPKDENGFSLKESELKQHLQNELSKIGDSKENTNTPNPPSKKDIITNEDIYNDIQLKSAIDALKILTVANIKDNKINIAKN
ncbi:S41 family peptidase [Helicobacter sp. MIT 14-3879]|uniref:S41 family peptidase n=1 Tax=Helicobacter sp. MIT 14-3879 TaxID=2040649 RepID=UPI000E1E4008|nr:S41 family peptidase [Helicobacter sp. MIT 14-3879]RDU62089.1 peptidase S41 [Helicobacter sp. MIT 14-3879]